QLDEQRIRLERLELERLEHVVQLRLLHDAVDLCGLEQRLQFVAVEDRLDLDGHTLAATCSAPSREPNTPRPWKASARRRRRASHDPLEARFARARERALCQVGVRRGSRPGARSGVLHSPQERERGVEMWTNKSPQIAANSPSKALAATPHLT